MIKHDIALALTDVAPINKATAIDVVDTIISLMRGHLEMGGRIEIRGFGVFENRPRKSGYGRNIKTGEAVKIPVGRSIRFKPGKELRDIASEDAE